MQKSVDCTPPSPELKKYQAKQQTNVEISVVLLSWHELLSIVFYDDC